MMKKYKFKLESYMKTKEMEKDVKMEELSFLNIKLAEIIQRIETANKDRQLLENKRDEFLKEGVGSLALIQMTSCINETTVLRNKAKEEKNEVEGNISKKKDELKKVMSEIKSLEKLDEKQFEEYREELKKEVEKGTEDILSSNRRLEKLKVSF